MNIHENNHRRILQDIARRAMTERGLLSDFSAGAIAEIEKIKMPANAGSELIRDQKDLLWSSIDNDDSRDLDQLTVAEKQPEGRLKVLVAIADVDSLVTKGSALDEHARVNTTSVYTSAMMFPMLPEKLSTNLTSLNLNEERQALVAEMLIGSDGSLLSSDVYRARVYNHAKLTYRQIAAWLDGSKATPEAVSSVSGLEENLRMQNDVTLRMKNLRHINGGLSLETIESKPVFDGDQIRSLEIEEKNRAKEIIEDLMIAANGVVARYLAASKFPSIRRVVHVPKRWDRIVEIAAQYKFKLPTIPDSKALEEFLVKQKSVDPIQFPDLSLTVIKLLGAGEYIAELPEENAPGHFGLAVKDYAHSTAPNRRYPDLLAQRLLKSALEKRPSPYSKEELDVLASHCTEAEDAAKKVERQVGKSAAALLFESRIGEQFDSIVTGASEKGTWVRLLTVPVEGKLVQGFEDMDVGDRIRVKLTSVDVEQGFIDFKKAGSARQ